MKKNNFDKAINYFKAILVFSPSTFQKKFLNSIAVTILHLKYFKKKINSIDIDEINFIYNILLKNINQDVLSYIGLGIISKFKGKFYFIFRNIL
jgi:hypothetical protein